MIRITGPTRAQLDQAADQYATLLDRELAFTIQRVIAWLGDQFDADDLGVIPKFWADRLDDLLAPTLALALHVGSADIRRQLRDMLGAGQGAQAVGPGGAQAAASARRRAGDQSGNATTIGSREPGGTLADTLTAAAWNGVPVTSQQLAEAYLATARNRLVGVGDLTWQLAREQLLEGQQAGESIAQLRDRVASATGLASPRAGVIARTTILDALNYGAFAEMLATGLDGTKEWLAVGDSRTRKDHVHADGQKVGIKEKFTVGDWPADRPHDSALPAEQAIQCRCGLSFSVDLDDVSLEPAAPAVEQAQEQVDHQILGAVWVADAIRRGVTADDLAALLSLAPFLPDDEEPEAETAAAEVLHLPGKHNQKTHGHSRKGGQISRPGMGDIGIDDDRLSALQGPYGGSAAPHLVQRPDGSYGFSPERQAMHDEIVRTHLEGKTPTDEPVYNMLGGGPASGKSTLVRQSATLQDPNTVVINADDIKDSLPEYRARIAAGDKGAGPFVHEESGYLAARVQAAAFEQRFNVTVDGVGDGSPPKLRSKVGAARAAGYRVNGQYVTVPTDTAVERANLRGQRSGRFVPESITRELHTGVSVTLPQTYEAFDSVDLFDNRGEGPLQHVMQWRDGSFTVHDSDLWDDFIAKGTG